MKESMNDTGEPCRECGAETAFHGYKHVEKVGRWTVTDGSTMAWQCRKCGTPQLTLDDLQGYQMRAVNTVLCDGKLEGAVLKYARKAVGLTQKELGAIIGHEHETISRWENDRDPLPRVVAAAVIGVLCRAIAGEQPEDMVAAARAATDGPASASTDLEVPVRRTARCA